jgi:hypothetical protein
MNRINRVLPIGVMVAIVSMGLKAQTGGVCLSRHRGRLLGVFNLKKFYPLFSADLCNTWVRKTFSHEMLPPQLP